MVKQLALAEKRQPLYTNEYALFNKSLVEYKVIEQLPKPWGFISIAEYLCYLYKHNGIC